MIDTLFDEIPKLFLFDMDHTLIQNDCDVSWKAFLVEKGIAPLSALVEADDYFEAYSRGELPIDTFIGFQLKEFIGVTEQELTDLSEEHFHTIVLPSLYPFWVDLFTEIDTRNLKTAIVTATNRIVAKPLAEYLGIDRLICTEPEKVEGKFTGKIKGKYCYSENKIAAALPFIKEHGVSFHECAYFGDSLSDFPLMKEVGFPIAVNPNALLKIEVDKRNWKELSLTLGEK